MSVISPSAPSCAQARWSAAGDLALDAGGRPWRQTVPRRGKKGGAVVEFTAGQRAVVAAALGTGYPRQLEAAYRAGELGECLLFPCGQLHGGRKGEDPVALALPRTGSTGSSRRAGCSTGSASPRRRPRSPPCGGAFYRLPRAATDHAKAEKASSHALMQLGGWADTQMPDRIYADAEADLHRHEATALRAGFRGESATATATPASADTPSATASTEPAEASTATRTMTPESG